MTWRLFIAIVAAGFFTALAKNWSAIEAKLARDDIERPASSRGPVNYDAMYPPAVTAPGSRQ